MLTSALRAVRPWMFRQVANGYYHCQRWLEVIQARARLPFYPGLLPDSLGQTPCGVLGLGPQSMPVSGGHMSLFFPAVGCRIKSMNQQPQSESFRKLGVPYFGVLIIRILLIETYYLGYYIRVPCFRKLPSQGFQLQPHFIRARRLDPWHL